jgi:hypothetical protein
MRRSPLQRNRLVLPAVMLMALALMFCEPGKSLDPQPSNPPNPPKATDSGFVAKIEVTSAPSSVLPLDTAVVELAFTDSATGNPLKGASLTVSSTQFAILSASAVKAFSTDSLPDDGKVSFRIVSTTTGNGTINVRVASGTKIRTKSISVLVTEKPVAPKVIETLPNKVAVKETTMVAFTIVDSLLERPLANAVVTVTSALYTVLDPKIKDTLSTDTTGNDGKAAFRVYTATNGGGAGTLTVKVKTAAGLSRTLTYTLATYEDSAQDRPRKMVFTAMRSSLRADATDSTELKVLVKDDNNNPLMGEKIRFTSTGGVIRAGATTDEWGLASTVLRSERVNKIVVVTATLEKTGATAQQSVAFDGVNIVISPAKRVLMTHNADPVLFELRDGSNNPISGDSMEVVAKGSAHGLDGSEKDSLLIVTDTKGQYRTSINSDKFSKIIIVARALGTKSEDTVTYTNNVLSLSSSKSSILGNGTDSSTITVSLMNGDNVEISGAEVKWTTTFGTFTSKPFTTTDGSGRARIVLRSSSGSGLAVVNVEAKKDGDLIASGNITIPVMALKVARLSIKVSPDNIPVKVGETRLTATAYDSAGNYMTGVLVGFRMVKGAGGGDEVISPPVDYTKAGVAEATFKAGGVISLYRGVKLAAVALDIKGTDTSVIASSDTVGLTVSGPPHRISVGVNIIKGENPNDGTFALPTAAVVTDVNGNLVADGTPVNFSTTPIGAYYTNISWKTLIDPPYYILTDTLWHFLPWTDYNNNGKLDPDESPSGLDSTRPARGEDEDGNGIIVTGEQFEDWNGNGVWDSVNAEPSVQVPKNDTSGKTYFVDFNRDGVQEAAEDYTDTNKDHICECAGKKNASGQWYEINHFGNAPNHPFPGEVSVGIPRQIETLQGKAATKITYVQSMARYVRVRITAEANGVTSTTDVDLPIVKDDK